MPMPGGHRLPPVQKLVASLSLSIAPGYFLLDRNLMQQSGGERAERCLRQIQRGERVAAVEKSRISVRPMFFSGTTTGLLLAGLGPGTS